MKLWNPPYTAWKVLAVKKFTSPTHPTQDDGKMNKEAGHSQTVVSRKVHIVQDTDPKSMQSLGLCIQQRGYHHMSVILARLSTLSTKAYIN